ncbi:uncharacterized protein [Salmo salar]|uniref:Uncharacterized protein n=1 Tax=Salmo salar TaxID=8030 RepID=A0A1S3NVL6_SALSA|nr:uncharacterized protein LOC106581733 [Salmo salar]|eukprot:XP_014019452.1 PREDICTED: uncharacterized protein LOC106581733 [Salmo salar]
MEVMGMGTIMGTDLTAMIVEGTVMEDTVMEDTEGTVMEDTEGTVAEDTEGAVAEDTEGTVAEGMAMGTVMGTVMDAGTGTSMGIGMEVVTSKGSRVMGVQAAPAAVTPTRACSQRDMTYPLISRKRLGSLSPVLYYSPRTNP